jgi:hypothetical protein
MFRTCVLAGLAVLPATAGFAAEHAVGLKVGALGLGVEYTHEISERLAVRGGINGSQVGFDGQESGIDYQFDVVWDSLSVAADFHPTKSPFRLTAGILRNDNGLNAESRPAGDVTIGSTTYTPAEVGVLRGKIDFDKTAPFLGLGWDWSRTKKVFGMSLDLGVLAQGSPHVALTATGNLLGDPAFAQDLRDEEAQLRDSLSNLDLLPYMTVGFVFRF